MKMTPTEQVIFFGWEAANKETVKEILITKNSNPNGYLMIAFNSAYRKEGRN